MNLEAVKAYFLALQQALCEQLAKEDEEGSFLSDPWEYEQGGGGGVTRVLTHGRVFERAGVNFSHVFGDALPQTGNDQLKALQDYAFEAMGVSVVIHPQNPYVPTAHMNVRVFIARKEGEPSLWWFGGGMDLTPFYPFSEDCIAWHQGIRAACDPFGLMLYPQFKEWADRYFYLKHRHEHRGIGGIFFDNLQLDSFEQTFAFVRSVGDTFSRVYLPIVQQRKAKTFSERERHFQCYRRGRYVEFNLLWDRGTLFGIQSNGRTESILMSMPPEVRWSYAWVPEPNTPEDKLSNYLEPREWADLA